MAKSVNGKRRSKEDLMNIRRKAAVDLLKGEIPVKDISKKYNINLNETYLIRSLVLRYGVDFLDDLPMSFNNEFKLRCVKDILENGKSVREVAIENKILSVRTINLWIEKFQKGELKSKFDEKDYNTHMAYKVYVDYKKGMEIKDICKKYNKKPKTIKFFIKFIEIHGYEAIQKDYYTHYSQELKKKIINEYRESNVTGYDLCLKYKLINSSVVYNWIFESGASKEKKLERYKRDYNVAKMINNKCKVRDILSVYKISNQTIYNIKRVCKYHGSDVFKPEIRSEIQKEYPKLEKEILKDILENDISYEGVIRKYIIPDSHIIAKCFKEAKKERGLKNG